jgi:cyclic beta-1,2-glucan synthetase
MDMAITFAQVISRKRRLSAGIDEVPLGGELYSVDHLEQYGRSLAATHKVGSSLASGGNLLSRLEENEHVLVHAYKSLADAIRRERTISPAAEWLVDNFHIVEEQLREIREDLPESYYAELPKLSEGELTGYPRIYAVALEIISHTDSRLDLEILRRFIRAYQRETALSIGELWAVAITLRLVLVENLRRLAARTVAARNKRAEANALADELLGHIPLQPDHLILLVRKRLQEEPDPAFVVQFSQRLHDQDPAVSAVLSWLDSQLALKGQSIEQVVQNEYQRQASSQVTVANIITSMRLLSTIDWREFFESVSLIDSLLEADPARAYNRMDFATRNRYRHVIERLSRRTGVAELEIGKRVLELAHRATQPNIGEDVTTHIGYYLIDDGLPQLERAVAFRPSIGERAACLMQRHPTIAYVGTIVLATSIIVALLTVYAASSGARGLMMAAVAVLSVIPASDLATSFMNWVFTLCVKPRPLPKMDTSSGISEPNRTIVVVPTLLTDEESVRELLGRVEVHCLSNQDEHIFFALLTDFADAPRENMSDDEMLLEIVRVGTAELNARYSGDGQPPRFHLFHRRRQWNSGERRWIGWERKRGKLHEFNRLIRGATDTSFVVNTADLSMLSQIRYVITLDSDTQLPHGTARRLIGTISHPLNRPYFDAELGRVTRGYGILQPRISISLVSASRSLFAQIFSGNTGVDPYTTAVSDVYQDWFGEGSYTGKGIYCVDAFVAALRGRVPENSLLSHDLFEGLYARAALVTDIELFDDYPERYDTYATRQHRWTRGDWQVAPWIMRHVLTEDGRRILNSLPLISRWKILDNLRRSLVAPAVMLWLVAAWTAFPGAPLLWTLFILLTFAFPVYAHVTRGLLIHPRGIPWTSHFWSIWGDVRINSLQVLLNIDFTAHQAYLMTDAIVRTFYRKLISKRSLLEWVTAQKRVTAADRKTFLRFMWPVFAITAFMVTLIVLLRTDATLVAAPFLIAWILSPFIAYRLSRPLLIEKQRPELRDAKIVRLIARRTWRFFETFVGEEDHWLPPDNYQEDPHPVIAHRTSPTNIGVFLLSTLAAHDFGYTGSLELIERFELTFTTLEKLPRFRGHFFNWYDTHTLEPLMPQYVSTVDSGNLAGHLIVIKQACNELLERPLFTARTTAGLSDTITLISQELDLLADSKQSTDVVTVKQLHREIDACVVLVTREAPQTLTDWSSLLTKLAERVVTIQDILNVLVQEHGSEYFGELRFWINAFNHQIEALKRDLHTVIPWAEVLARVVSARAGRSPDDLSTKLEKISNELNFLPVPSRIPELCDQMLVQLAALRPALEKSLSTEFEQVTLLDNLDSLTNTLERGVEANNSLRARTGSLSRLCGRLVNEADFGFLFDDKLKVLTIGYNVTDSRRDESFYDLLASEARLASFIAIASGDVPQEHWFRLGRQLTSVDGRQALMSWSATMFEYLMPLLVMRNYEKTLLGETYRVAIARQIAYGREHAVPWGVSESAYNARDLDLTYQYAPFGVPGMGFKRGLSQNLVIAPYATLLAAMLQPKEGVQNIARLEQEGALARFGFYEALDYTPDRLPPNQRMVLIRAFMTHHQGMSMVALDNLIHDYVMQNRFHSDALVQANELLLQERVPRGARVVHPRVEAPIPSKVPPTVPSSFATRRYNTPDQPSPRVQLLSNGTYSAMVTSAGAGYSWCGSIAITRWREDASRDNWGSFFYLRDVSSGAVWSAGYQPTLRQPQFYDVSFSEHKVDIQRSDVGLLTHTEIFISTEDNVELRGISITNQSSRIREIEVTSYAEVVLTSLDSDAAHPAFSNLFVETEFITSDNALLAQRRARSEREGSVWGVHTVVTEGEVVGVLQYETDRRRFVGRGHSVADPSAINEGRPLSNSFGAVLDPIFSLRQRVRVRPNETARLYFATALAHSREQALNLADKYHDAATFEREARLAWMRCRVEMRHLEVDLEEAQLFQRLAGLVLYLDRSLRPRPHVLALNSKTQTDLWPYGISGDLPIILVRIRDARNLRIVKQVLRGHAYLRSKGLSVDLVILNDHPTSYSQSLHDELLELVRKSGTQHLVDKPGGVFIRRSDIMPEADRILLHTVARVCIVTERGSLEEHLSRPTIERERPAPFIPSRPSHADLEPTVATNNLRVFNGLGGFSQDGREYVTTLAEGQWTPEPWLNVIANSVNFGFQVSETGASCTWSVNSHENRLTPWSNDAVSDLSGEVIYLRDEDTGYIWTPTPLPIRETNPYVIRHGQGYTSFEHTSHGIVQELLMFVPIDAAVKVARLRLHNKTDQKRRLSVTSYTELVLGTQRSVSAPFINTEVDQTTGAILARNPYNNEFAHRVTFVEMSESERTITCDRKEFLGRNGSTARPAALRRTKLSGAIGAGLDPCIALQAVFELGPGEHREIMILLGQTENLAEARLVVSRFRQMAAVREAFEKLRDYWNEILGAVEVHTPDAAMDIMMNRWLVYQALSCRVWARSAFYQSSGAYGFRDQLQDVMALVYAKPEILREHILRAAARQFPEGDVQHWWHPPTGRGARTRLSDDAIWLPYVTHFYINVTGDHTVLDEKVPFIEAPGLAVDEMESFSQPSIATTSETLFEHCARALDRSLSVGIHGLPLMGTGDWNDGMNRVGFRGKGESVWLGWFLYKTLADFLEFCDARGEADRARNYREHLIKLKTGFEQQAWDGDWYVRAFFDDGTPLGSARNDECRIDSIAQSWGIISGAADLSRARRAMASVEQHLILREQGLVLLLAPPFDKGVLEPGYIKGYVPGVRENGGQYTHAALWALIAFAMLGDGDRAGDLFALLNPINQASTRAGMHRYKVEPYVVAADVYGAAHHTGRGGWTWYTGAAAWMYRAGLESMLGFKLRGGRLTVEPSIPRSWLGYEVTYRRGKTVYQLKVENPHRVSVGVVSVELDGALLPLNEIPLEVDGNIHEIRIVLGNKTLAREDETVSLPLEQQQKF